MRWLPCYGAAAVLNCDGCIGMHPADLQPQRRGRAFAKTGIQIDLTAEEQEAFARSVAAVSKTCGEVDDMLGSL